MRHRPLSLTEWLPSWLAAVVSPLHARSSSGRPTAHCCLHKNTYCLPPPKLLSLSCHLASRPCYLLAGRRRRRHRRPQQCLRERLRRYSATEVDKFSFFICDTRSLGRTDGRLAGQKSTPRHPIRAGQLFLGAGGQLGSGGRFFSLSPPAAASQF